MGSFPETYNDPFILFIWRFSIAFSFKMTHFLELDVSNYYCTTLLVHPVRDAENERISELLVI